MANRTRRYKVYPRPAMSDDEGETYFVVTGPRVNEFAVMEQLAAVMQRALNHPKLTPRQRNVMRSALAFAMAGEHPEDWTYADSMAATELLNTI